MSISLNGFTCPHCLKENATLFDVARFNRPISKQQSLVFTCRTCDKSLIIDLNLNLNLNYLGEDEFSSSRENYIAKIEGDNFKLNNSSVGWVINLYPKTKMITIPENIPCNIGKYLLESKEHLKRGYYETSAMVCRKSLDLATKELAKIIPGSEKITKLTKRIHLLKDNGVITKDIFDWSIIIRDDGDEATHSDTEFSEGLSKELIDFTELFLMYTFTLPEMVKIKRPKKQDDSKSNI